MRSRKAAADYASSCEGTLKRGWGNKRATESEMEDESVSLITLCLINFLRGFLVKVVSHYSKIFTVQHRNAFFDLC